MKRALVIGCANEVWQEVEEAQKLGHFDTIYCVKMAGIYWAEGPFVWVGLHPEFWDRYKLERTKLGLPHDCYETVAPLPSEVGNHHQCKSDRNTSFRFPGMTSSGASGLFAVKVAMEDGHDRIVLAGVPMTRETGHFVRGAPWQQFDNFTSAWKVMKPKLQGRVKSVSGWTRELLGAPDQKWFDGTD